MGKTIGSTTRAVCAGPNPSDDVWTDPAARLCRDQIMQTEELRIRNPALNLWRFSLMAVAVTMTARSGT
jgi:hypothetical protein